MSASAILILTVLLVLLVLAVALLTGSLALLARNPGQADEPWGGIIGALRVLDRQWQIERLIYRHHRLFGAIVLLAGAFFFWQLARFERPALFNEHSTTMVLAWVLLVGQTFNLIIGLVILLRPSLLKPVEAVSNRWHRLEASGSRHPRTIRWTALILALVGLVILLATATLIYQQITTFMP